VLRWKSTLLLLFSLLLLFFTSSELDEEFVVDEFWDKCLGVGHEYLCRFLESFSFFFFSFEGGS